jgi:hypothetical protein
MPSLASRARIALPMAEADRDRNPDIAFDGLGETGKDACRRRVMQPVRSAQIKKGLVDRQRLNGGREIAHHGAELPADNGVFFHVRANDDCVRAGFQSLEHRHGGMHAECAGDVAGSRHHAAAPATDDHGLFGKARIIALFDGGVERIAIDVRDCEIGQFGMCQQAWTATVGAASTIDIGLDQAIPAQTQTGNNMVFAIGHRAACYRCASLQAGSGSSNRKM